MKVEKLGREKEKNRGGGKKMKWECLKKKEDVGTWNFKRDRDKD